MLRVLSTPALFSLELTPLCNGRCVGCFTVFDKAYEHSSDNPSVRRPSLSCEQWCRVLDLLAPHAHRLKLTGGEPTLHPEFECILDYASRLGASLTVFTNGLWLHPDRVLHALSRTPNLTGILVSLHGVRAASHETYSGVAGSFEEIIANVRRAVATGVSVTLSTVMHQANLGELAEVVELAEALGADHVVFNRYLGPPVPEIAITDEQLMQATQAVDEMRQQGRPVTFGNCIPQCFTRSSSTGCLAGVAFCTVDPWGNLRPCNHSPLIAGNLLDVALEEAWQSPEMALFRQAIPEACYRCQAFSTCHGGCKALAMELGLPSDPLMKGELREFSPPAVNIGRNWRPLRCFEMRQESFGLVLIRGNALLAVRPEALPVLERLDGSQTIGELESELGPGALALVGELFRRNLIDVKV